MDLFPIPAAAIPERLVMAGNWWEKESEKKGNAKKKNERRKIGGAKCVPPISTYRTYLPGTFSRGEAYLPFIAATAYKKLATRVVTTGHTSRVKSSQWLNTVL